MRQLTLAVTFLTGIPLRVEGDVTPADLWRSMGWYPLVGLVIGAAAWAVYAGLTYVLPGLVAAILVVIFLELLTRGLHMDGVMDTADGILSGAPRDRALEIMKDHNVGAMGVVAAVLLLLLKVAALGALARPEAAAPLLAGWTAARALPALDVYLWPYARPAGTGEAFTRERTPGPVVMALGFLVAGVVVAGFAGLLLGALGSWYAGIVAAVASMAVALGVQALVARKLGGLTGDVYGMGIELAEATAVVTAVVVVGVLLKLYLVRHGQSTGNVGEHLMGQSEHPLTPLGELQAAAAAKRLAPFGPMPVYHSDLPRAVATARSIVRAWGGDPALVPDARLREISLGDYEGASWARFEADTELMAAFKRDPYGTAVPGGESLAHLVERVIAAVRDILGACDVTDDFELSTEAVATSDASALATGFHRPAQGENACIVAHDGPIRAILNHYLGVPPDKWWTLSTTHGGVSLLEFSGGWVNVRYMNAAEHLAGLEPDVYVPSMDDPGVGAGDEPASPAG